MAWLRRSAAAVVCALALGVGSAAAHDHAPPDATLLAGKAKQGGELVLFCWIRGAEAGGAALCRQEGIAFPEPEPVRADAGRVVFDTDREPIRTRIRAWRRLSKSGEPRRPVRRIEGVSEPTEDGPGVGFALPTRPGTWYLEVKGVWTDVSFPESEQFAVWTFAIEVR